MARFVILLVLALVGCSGKANALPSVVIASCYDGDTCSTTEGESVRLACIDTQELSNSNPDLVPAKAARDYLRSRLVGKEVLIRRVDTDRYGRTVGDLYLKPFESVGLDMVSSGHAVIYRSYAKQCPWANELLVDGLTRYERRKKPVFAVLFRVRADRLYQRHWRFPSRASLESSTSNEWQHSLTYKKRQSGSTWGTSFWSPCAYERGLQVFAVGIQPLNCQKHLNS